MQRTISVNGFEHYLILAGLAMLEAHYKVLPNEMSNDECKMKIEEIAKLIKRLSEDSNKPIGGVFIDGERM